MTTTDPSPDPSETLIETEGNPDHKDYLSLLEGDPQAVLDRHKQTATSLLGISIDYCEEFVPSQIAAIESHITKVNDRIGRSGNPIDVQGLTASLLSLLKAHSEVLERAVIVYMSNTRPLVSLLTTNQLEFSEEVKNPQLSDSDAEEQASEGGIFEDDDEDLESLHQPYQD